MGKMKMGFVSDVVKGLTIERMGDELDGKTRFYMTNGAVVTVEACNDAEYGMGTNVSVDADWDYED